MPIVTGIQVRQRRTVQLFGYSRIWIHEVVNMSLRSTKNKLYGSEVLKRSSEELRNTKLGARLRLT